MYTTAFAPPGVPANFNGQYGLQTLPVAEVAPPGMGGPPTTSNNVFTGKPEVYQPGPGPQSVNMYATPVYGQPPPPMAPSYYGNVGK